MYDNLKPGTCVELQTDTDLLGVSQYIQDRGDTYVYTGSISQLLERDLVIMLDQSFQNALGEVRIDRTTNNILTITSANMDKVELTEAKITNIRQIQN